ncbi:MAG: hypothetical protein J6M41_05000 [Prevotella sp.]|nr:hypothetical protein [Prevotella sp.]
MMNELEIRTLTERFFDGETSLAEERRLYQLYSEAKTLPADLEALREMMLDLGRLDAQIPTLSTQIPTPNPSRGEGSLKSLPADNATYKTNQTSLPSGGVGGGYLGVWLSLAASLLLLFTLGSMWYGYERQNECVAYVYGERVTDRELVMHEMQTAMTSLAADDATATMEQQMKELFAE